MLSPATILPGERTSQYRLGGDQLLTDANGESRISVEDYAKAMIDTGNAATPQCPVYPGLLKIDHSGRVQQNDRACYLFSACNSARLRASPQR